VIKFNTQDFFERAFGDINAGKGKLQNPMKLVATNSRIFVGDKNKILLYDYFGNYLGSIGEGIINNLNGFTIVTNGLLAASSDRIWWFSREGALQMVSSLDNIISGERIDQIQDIAFSEKQLFILSSHKIHVFKIRN
jgi:hypothetical protein